MESKGVINKVSGPLVIATGMNDANMYDVVRVSRYGLIGEIIEMHGDKASIQVYEETSGLGPGEEVISTGSPLSVELGPGLIKSIYDGIQRPLDEIMKKAGTNLQRGISVPALNREIKWDFQPVLKAGDKVLGGAVLGTVQETDVVEHKIMVPPNIEGEIIELNAGSFTVTDVIGKIKDKNGKITELNLMQKWPVRVGRPYKEKLSPDIPLVTGQRVIDTLFPIAKGGVGTVPGPFGSEKQLCSISLQKGLMQI